MAKKKKKKQKLKKSSGLKISVRGLLISIIVVVLTMLYLSSAILFFVGMLPTLVAYFTDDKPGKNKTFTIGAINFAACFFYLIHSWVSMDPDQKALEFLSDPLTIIIIYSAAGIGYITNYVSTIFVSSALKQKSHIRLEKLEKEKKKLEERWGTKVNGERALDSNGRLVAGFDSDEGENS